jgi:hypothetical protein
MQAEGLCLLLGSDIAIIMPFIQFLKSEIGGGVISFGRRSGV